ncbi:hypothetical protein [Agromyces bauzanensis]
MNAINKLIVTVQVATGRLFDRAAATRKRFAEERGSLTLEQIIWTVAIALVAIAIVAIVVNAINTKAAELPL